MFSEYENSKQFPSSSSVRHLFFVSVLVIKITIDSSYEDSSMLVSDIIVVEGFYKSSLNLIISSVNIPCYHSVTRMLYI